MQDIYSIPIIDIAGNETTLEEFRGKVLLIVNVASQCGLADKNYAHLSVLLSKYHSRGLEILLFPSNDFLGQEPGTIEEISERVKTIHPNFRIYGKINVLGKKRHPIYTYLIDNHDTLWFFSSIKWNFTKFLVGRDGKVLNRYMPIQYLDNDKEFSGLFPEKEN